MVTRIGRIIDASESDVKARKPFEMVQPQVILSTDAEEIEEEGFEDEYGVRFEDLTQQVATELMRTMKSTRRAMRSSNGGK